MFDSDTDRSKKRAASSSSSSSGSSSSGSSSSASSPERSQKINSPIRVSPERRDYKVCVCLSVCPSVSGHQAHSSCTFSSSVLLLNIHNLQTQV